MGRASRPKGSTLAGFRSSGTFLSAEEMLDDLGVPEEYIECFERARKHLEKISRDPQKAREAEVVRTQLLASYANLADNMYEDGSSEVDMFLGQVRELSRSAMEEAKEMAKGCDTSDWSSHDYLFYRLYHKARQSFDKIDSANARAIREYLDTKNEGRDPLRGGLRFSAIDYREQALLLHGACLVEENPEMRQIDAELRAAENEVRRRASVGGKMPEKTLISLPRSEWSTSSSGGAVGSVRTIPEEADALLMDQEPSTMGFVSGTDPNAPVFILAGAIQSMREEGSNYDVREIAIHELIHTLQPPSLRDQQEVVSHLKEQGVKSFAGGPLAITWKEGNTELLRVLRGHPELVTRLEGLEEVQFAYKPYVFELAKILERFPPEKRLPLVERFNELGTVQSWKLLEGVIDNPALFWKERVEDIAAQKQQSAEQK